MVNLFDNIQQLMTVSFERIIGKFFVIENNEQTEELNQLLGRFLGVSVPS
ncbi:hypothetical protein [Allobaculum sp. Allo2]|nr:hypothetical protein [Allobaculum sp. Allo2]